MFETYIRYFDPKAHKIETKDIRDYNFAYDTLLTNCSMCYKGFTSEWVMINHKESVHAKV